MEKLYHYFPLSSSVTPSDTKSLVISILIYVAACAVLRVLGVVLGWIPLVGWLLGIVFSLIGLYCVAGIVLSVLQYFKK